MLLLQLVTAVIPLVMATSSTQPSDQGASSADVAPEGTRDIRMWTDNTNQNTTIKYLHVPDTYALIDIKHVDHVGMFYTFKNGDTWLTLNNKRLFLTPDMDEPDIDRGSEDAEDWPVMSPEELKEALANHPSYEELNATWQGVQEERRAVDPLERRTTSCQTVRCNYSYDCYPLSTTYEDCYRCSNHRCTYRVLLPNAIGPISGKRGEEEEQEEGQEEEGEEEEKK